MKKLVKFSLVFLLFFFTFSCGDDIVEKVTVDVSEITGGAVANLLSPSYVLTYANANNNFETISWEATDYGYATSITYTLQIAVAGNNFADAEDLTTTTELFAEVNIEDLNDALVEGLSLTPEVSAALQLRVVSSLSGEIADVYSDPVDVNITPYDPDIPPIYLIGDLQGWNLDNAVALQSIAPLIYTGFADFDTDVLFRFFELLDWVTGEQWGFSYFTGDIPDEFGDSGDGDSNFQFTSLVAGTYAITVDLNTKSIEIEKQLFPSSLYIIGDDQAWSLDDALALRHVGGGVFEAIETLGNGNWWRFFETPSWGGTQWNYNTFIDGTIDPDLSGTTAGDANFQFIGTTGIYKITVSTLDLTIDIEPAQMPTMYRVGGDNGWTFGESMTWIRGEKFTEVTELTAGNEWRFFPTSGVWGFTRDYNAFKNVDPTLWSGPNGGDANFLNLVTGTYRITIDVVPGIITGELQ
ncbi:MAG: SusE domain-containing protein [Bacteroidales bacterium]|nr:SusE domain-containing protein [Bacteroidales bacterium]